MPKTQITEEDKQLIIGAINTLGMVAIEYDHEWSDGERAIYEEAMRILIPGYEP